MTTDIVRAPAEALRRSSRGLRQLVPWLLALAVATCTQDNVGPSRGGVGYFAFRPVYPMASGMSLSQFGIVADSVHVVLTRPVNELVLDTTVAFPADSNELRLALPVELASSPEVLDAVIEISAGGVVIFRDSVQVTVKDGAPGAEPPPVVSFNYVGPGSNIASLTVVPGDTTLTLGDTLFFTASAIDSSDAPVANFYVGWKTSDTLIARINAAGRLIAPLLRGNVRVIGLTPTGIADTTVVTFAPVPVIITADSGNLQSALVGDSLGTLLVARVKGADSLGISGIPVRFAAVTAGGSVRDTVTLITDANGRVRTRAFLGTLAGNYSYTATALGTGLPARTFTATANVSAATAIAIQSGNAQVDTVTRALAAPFVVHVTDAFGNNVVGAPVLFTRTTGFGVLADDTVFTAAGGLASVGYTLGGPVGTDSIRAALVGTSAFVMFTAQGTPDVPAINQLFSGDGQTAVAGTPFAAPLVVRVEDGHNNTVPGAKVGWTITSGLGTLSADTSVTDSIGRATITVTAGTLADDLVINAQVPGVGAGATITLHVTAAAPASMVIASGNGQTGPAGVVLPLSPEVRITDAFNNPIAGLTVDFAVTAGGGSIDSTTATTDSTGRANSGLWTLGVAGLNQVRATSSAVPADTLLYDATATPAGTTKLWTGAVDDLWTTAGNWSPTGMPVGGDNLFIPAGVTSPVLNTPTVTGGLAIETGATVTVTSGVTLQLSGNLDLDGDLTGAGNLTLTGSGATLNGNVSLASVLVNGTLSLNGATTISGPLNVNTGTLTVGGQTLSVSGALTVGGSGQLVMTNAADSVDVGGNTTISTATTGTGNLSAGVLMIRGAFTQTVGSATNFAPSGTHTVRFLGTGVQTVSFGSPGSAQSRFQNVEFGSSAGTTLNSTFTAMGIVTANAGTVTGIGRTANIGGGLVTDYAKWQVSTTLWGQDPTVYPDSLPRNVTVFNAWTLTKPFKTDSSLTVSASGTLTLNGKALRVGGSFTQTGRLSMSNAADSLDVQGLFTVNSGLSGVADLSDGVLVLRGGFTQTAGATNNFQAGGTHRVRFLGSAPQAVSFASSGVTNSRFADVEFGDPAGVTLSTNVYAAGATAVTAGTVTGVGRTATLAGGLSTGYAAWQVSTTLWVGTPSVYPDSLPRNVTLGALLTLNKGFKVDSAMTITPAGYLGLNGHTVRIGGGLTQTGMLGMQDPADTLDVGGLFTVNSGLSGSAMLTEGLLRLRGGMTQTAGDFANFAPSNAHLTEFVGSGGHALSLTSFDTTNSHFQHLVVRDSLTVSGNLAVLGDVTLAPTGRLVGPAIGILLGDLVDSSLAGWRMTTTQLNGKFQSIPSALVSNVTLTDSLALAQNTSVTGSFTLQGAGYIAFGGHGLGVSGNFTQDSRLVMSSTQDSLDVGGTFLVSSGSDGTGDLTAGVLVLRGGFTQTSGSFTNFMADAPHRTIFTGAAARTIDLTTPNQVHFGDLVMNASGLITFNTDVHANGSFTVAGGPVAITAAAQRLLRVQDLAVDGLSLDRVRLEMHGTSNAAQVDNVTFTNIAPTLDQLSLELPGQTGDTLKFNNVSFSGTPSTGHYVFVADSVANDAPAVIGFYNSTPLNGALYTAVEGTVGDPATILWTHLDWVTQPTDAIQLVGLTPTPQVGVFDPSNAPVTGYTGTVTLGFFANPVGAVLGNNSVAAVGGVATFDSLTVSLAGVGFQLQATTSDLGVSPPSALFNILVPIPSGTTTAFNNGGGDNDWFNAANWTFGVPDSLDNVYVLPGQTVTVNSLAQTNRLTLGTGATIVLNSLLTVDSSVVAGNTISGGGQLIAKGSGELSGQVGPLYVTGTYTVPTGDQLQAQNIVIGGAGVLDPGQAQIIAVDSLITEVTGQLNINYPGATVTVQGRARFSGGASQLLDGTLYLGGDFLQEATGAFAPAPGFTTVFNGAGPQTVNFTSPATNGDRFQEVMVDNGTTVLFPGVAFIMGGLQISGGTVDVSGGSTFINGDISGSTGAFLQGSGRLLLAGSNFFGGVYGVAYTSFVSAGQTLLPMSSPYDTLVIEGQALLGGNIAAGSVQIPGGQLLMGGRRLDVAGDFSTSSGGQFAMNSAADTLIVGGNFNAAGGSTDGLLIDGLLEIHGSFNQSPDGSAASFRAGASHLTRFTGGAGTERVIAFGTPVQAADPFSTNNSRFGRLELTDGIDSLASTIPVDGDFLVVSAAVLNMVGGSGGPAVTGNVAIQAGVPQFTVQNLSLGGVLDFQPAPALYQVGTTLFFGDGQAIPALPYQDIEVAFGQATMTSDLTVGNVRTGVSTEGPGFPGDLRLGGHHLTVAGNFTTTGQGSFTMDDPADSLDVTGQADLGGGVTTGLTAGTMVVRGDMYLQDSNFVASGTHKTVFAAPGSQQLWITTAPVPSNQFNRVTVLAGTTVNFNAFSVGPMVAADTFWVNGFFLQANPGKKIIALADLYAGLAAGITVDTVEVHQGLEIDASGYSTQLTRYAGTGQLIASNVSYTDVEVTGTAALGATTAVNRDLRVAKSGQLQIGPFTLAVGGAFKTVDSGTVSMLDPASEIDADTAVFAGGSTAGLLSAGTLRTRALIQLNPTSDLSYFANGTHTTQIGTPLGGAEYRIEMATGDQSRSRIKHLLLADGGVGSVPTRIVGRVTVVGKLLTVSEGSGGIIGDPGAFLSVNDSLIVQDPATDIAIDTLELYGGIQIPNNTLASSVVRFMIAGQVIPDSQTYAGIEVWGNVGIEPALVAQRVRVLNNGRITIGSGQGLAANVVRTEQNGTLEMAGPTAQLQVLDTLVMAGGSTAGLLRQGFLTLSGDLVQDGTNSAQSFAVDSQMYTFFTNPAGQVVTLATPGNAGSHFGFVNLQPNAVVSINAAGTVPVWGEMNIQNGANLGSNAGIDVAQNMVSGSGSMVTAPLFIFRTGSAPDPSTTWNVARTAIATPDTMNIPQVNYLGDLEVWTQGRFVFPVNITGALRVGGAGNPAYASWSNATVTAGGLDVIDNSRFGMTNGLDSLLINGTAHFDGGYLADQLTGGTIIFGGDIVQDSTFLTQSFGASGTQLVLTPAVTHKVTFASPDNSPWPIMTTGALGGTLDLVIVGRLVVAGGGLNANGLNIAGDTLELSGPLDAGSSQINLNLKKYLGPLMDQFANVGTWNVITTQFMTGGSLPFNDFTFDTLIVSEHVGGQLSQNLNASYVEVTGPGNPRHVGDGAGFLELTGGDGNTNLAVSGDVVVRGAGAHIGNYEGFLSATGDLTVDQDGYLAANGSFGGGNFDIDGNVVIDGTSTKDSLVQGSLMIGGKFTQKATTNSQSYAPDSLFTTQFKFGGTHTVSFATPSPAGGGGSYFGGLSFSADAGLVMETDTDLWVEGILSTQSYSNPILRNTAAGLRTITVQDVSIQGITFDHLQLHLAKTTGPASSAGNVDIVNFTGFLTTEDQFLVDLPGIPFQYSWSNFSFTPLSGTDTGHYVVANDTDGGTPDVLVISIGTNQSNLLSYSTGLNGAIINLFAP